MKTTHYQPSGAKPPVEIAGMPYPYLKSAHAKLLRDEPHRADEIDAMAERIAELDAAYQAAQGDAA